MGLMWKLPTSCFCLSSSSIIILKYPREYHSFYRQRMLSIATAKSIEIVTRMWEFEARELCLRTSNAWDRKGKEIVTGFALGALLVYA